MMSKTSVYVGIIPILMSRHRHRYVFNIFYMDCKYLRVMRHRAAFQRRLPPLGLCHAALDRFCCVMRGP